jgi:hypothetical protein
LLKDDDNDVGLGECAVNSTRPYPSSYAGQCEGRALSRLYCPIRPR